MATRITLRRIGNSTGLLLPKAALDHLKLEEGDAVFLVETSDGLELTPYDPEFEAQLESAERVMKRYRNTFRKLAE